MIRTIIFDDEIALWWEYTLTEGEKTFDCFLNGECYGKVASTDVSFMALQADTEYAIKIIGEKTTVFDGVIRTRKSKNKIDVSLPPYNAVGDGETLNTRALQKALDDCTKNDCVYIPQGIFLTGALRMHDDTELYLAKDAVLQGTENAEDYLPKIKSRFEGLEFMCYSSLLNAGELNSQGEANCKNIVVRGAGKIIGGGNPLREKILEVENLRLSEELAALGDKIKEFENKDTIAGRFRPRLINISNVDNFVMTGIEFGSSPSWNLHMVYSKNLTVYNCKVVSHGINNGDGIDPDSVENCAIFHCQFDTSDDCIAVKSGRNPEGNVVNRKSASIYIFDCVAVGHSICVGSEMSGGVENVYIWDCDLSKSDWGLQMKYSQKRGGYIRNVVCKNCVASRIMIWIPSYNNDGEGAPTVPQISDIHFEDCVLYGEPFHWEKVPRRYIMIEGIDEENPVRRCTFNNVTLKNYEECNSIVLTYTQDIQFNNLIKE